MAGEVQTKAEGRTRLPDIQPILQFGKLIVSFSVPGADAAKARVPDGFFELFAWMEADAAESKKAILENLGCQECRIYAGFIRNNPNLPQGVWDPVRVIRALIPKEQVSLDNLDELQAQLFPGEPYSSQPRIRIFPETKLKLPSY